MKKLQEKIQNIDPGNINESDIAVIESTIQELDNGTVRVANYQDGEWTINEWVRDAILLFFSVRNLKEINAKLWVIEDDKRQCEKDKDFGEKFIKLSRDVHFLNDDRAKIKLEINNHSGSTIKEIKEYTNY